MDETTKKQPEQPDPVAVAAGGMMRHLSRLVAAATTTSAPLPAHLQPPAFRPPTVRTDKLRGPITCRVSQLVDQTLGVPGHRDVRKARDGRLYRIAEGTLRRLHAKPRGKAARRAEKEARRAARRA